MPNPTLGTRPGAPTLVVDFDAETVQFNFGQGLSINYSIGWLIARIANDRTPLNLYPLQGEPAWPIDIDELEDTLSALVLEHHPVRYFAGLS